MRAQAGADKYLLKDEDPELIPDALLALASGAPWCSPAISPVAITILQNMKRSSTVGFLTEREVNTIQHLIEGHTNNEMDDLNRIRTG